MSFMAQYFDVQSADVDTRIERIIDLIEADEQILDGLATKYRRGTTEILLQKVITGSTCADKVSLTQDPPP